MTATQTAFTESPRAREYETIYILRSAVDPDEADRIATRVREVIGTLGGKILRVDNWGRRRLAHPIGKATRQRSSGAIRLHFLLRRRFEHGPDPCHWPEWFD